MSTASRRRRRVEQCRALRSSAGSNGEPAGGTEGSCACGSRTGLTWRDRMALPRWVHGRQDAAADGPDATAAALPI